MKRCSAVWLMAMGVFIAALGAVPASASGETTNGRVDGANDEGRDGCRIRTDDVIPCDGVRPGASLSFAGGTGGACTMNFLFQGSDGRTYVGTAGHCIFDGEGLRGQRAWRPGTGIETYDGEGNRIGATAFWALDHGLGLDFGLIRLDAGSDWNPQMCEFGGPTGVYKGVDTEPATINFFGNQSDVGRVVPARTFVAATGLPHRSGVDAFGVAFFGDSGGPTTLEDGRALGVLFGTGFGYSGLPGDPDFTAGNLFIVRLPPQLKAAEQALHIDLNLLKAPPL